jgi:hypothetical protein
MRSEQAENCGHEVEKKKKYDNSNNNIRFGSNV